VGSDPRTVDGRLPSGRRASELEDRFLKVVSPEAQMKNKDELKGKAKEIKGKVKQGLGDLTDDERLHDEGVADEAEGDVQEGLGRARRKVGEAIEEVGEKVKR
jgi:uncharacterized protein YjbJ (UPF0337 family)